MKTPYKQGLSRGSLIWQTTKAARYKEQNGKCTICGITFHEKREVFLDHNHETGQLRSVLCKKCNSGLAYFKEDTRVMQKAIMYLKRWSIN